MGVVQREPSRAITLLIYMPSSPRPWEYVRTVDALESAWSLSRYIPFKGQEPIHFGYRWETLGDVEKLNGKYATRVWNGITRELMRRRFLNPDGAEILPGEMFFKNRPPGQIFSRAEMTFWRY